MADIKDEVDLVSRLSGFGTLTEATGNSLYGINHRGVGNPVPYNTENHGLTFFTRPRLNLSYDNMAMDRVFTPLLTSNPFTYQRAIRAMLDPVGNVGDNDDDVRGVSSPLVDNKSAFINILSNNLLSLSGWPDPVVAYFNATDGPAKETWSMVDDVHRNFNSFNLQASFRNIAGDPITLLFYIWLRYAANVYSGLMMPYPDSVIENEIDYQTRIYRLVLDPSRQFVQKIAACGAAFPVSSPLGAAFNFSSDSPLNQENSQQISIPFQCIGVDYLDPILVKEFNDIVGFFNIDMQDDRRTGFLIKLNKSQLNLFNYHGYPRINPFSLELEWWVYRNEFFSLVGK